VEGLHESQVGVHALTGATVVIKPGSRLENATLVIRDGTIAAVGQGIEVPPGARVWDMSGRTIYAALIDAYSETELPGGNPDEGAVHWNRHIRPQDRVADAYKPDVGLSKTLRGQGIGARLLAPSEGIIRGVSAVVTTDDPSHSQQILNEEAALHMRLSVSWGRSRDSYPNSPMGAVALARQTMYDADWYARAHEAFAKGGVVERPESNDSLAALHRQLSEGRLVILDATNELFALRAADFANEFDLKHVALRGSGNEYRRLEEIAALKLPVIVPVDFPKPPNVASAAAARDVRLEHLLHWDMAPENPARMAAAGIEIALTSQGLSKRGEFLAHVRQAIERGLPADEALWAVTLTPAKLLGVADRLGSLEAGKAASLIVTDGELFAKKTRVMETWIEGRRYVQHAEKNGSLAGTWSLQIQSEAEHGIHESLQFELKVSGEGKVSGKATGTDADGKDIEAELKNLEVNDLRIEFSFDARRFGGDGVARFSMPVGGKAKGSGVAIGRLAWPDGLEVTVRATRKKTADKSNEEEDESDDEDEENDEPKAASFAVNYPLGAFGIEGTPEQPKAVLFTGAVVWTCVEAGNLEGASVLVEGGVIKAVGKQIEPPEGCVVIDLAGKHLTPGIIDCHSHMATDGGVNESSQAVTAEVRIGDFVDPDDMTIYRQLAGGVTAANILHGSANPIGGQNQVIKLRWGDTPNGMKFADAPPGIKFALGENVKQSNWGDDYTSRYPQTRMGVEQIMRDRFHAAQAYRERQAAWEQEQRGLPQRRDLELDAIAEILEHKRWVHCHSYRQDEILALIRTADDFDFTIGTFQHILEGYKVADAMAKHGAMGSAFSDWWAYKFEVYDAIPFNGALMHRAGVVVSFNSDDDELGRHLNHEAAKAMKYGGLPEEAALNFVTLNPAKQLRIEEYVGSIEEGKHADLVVWSESPLSTYSRCEQTWIDGRKYFDMDQDRELRRKAAEIRRTLVQKILSSGLEMLKAGEEEVDESELWPRRDLFCGAKGNEGER